MKTPRMLAAVLSLSACLAMSAAAQMSAEVQFQPGTFGTMVSGTITGDEYFDHSLGARAGQEMFAELTVAETDGTGTVYFNILPPGSEGEAIYIGSINGNTARIELPTDGTYAIRVYLMGSDRDAGKTVGYNLDLSIQ